MLGTCSIELSMREAHIHTPVHSIDQGVVWCGVMQVVYGLDYRVEDAQEQHASLRRTILEHVKAHHTSLLVVEEYDKLSCRARRFLRQFIENTASPDVSLSRQAQ